MTLVDPAAYIDLAALGQWTEEHSFGVDAARTAAFARATNDLHPRHLDGTYAPPLFIVVPSRDAFIAARSKLLPRGLPPGIPPLLGRQDFRFLAPITPGDILVIRSAAIGVHGKTSGTTFVLRINVRNQRQEAVSDQFVTLFFPRFVVALSAGDEAPPVEASRSPGQPVLECTLSTDRDQTFRYSAVSGDPSRMHLDAEVARSMGLPGIIMHGLCTAAFVARAVVESAGGGDPLLLRRLAVRFSRPLIPGEQITTALWAESPTGEQATYALESRSSSGQIVISHGLAELGPRG